ncbi:MAG: PH domain-containing protein [Bacillota bacterium]|nr:PH domain-containing protein [Bacillota bacterium]
MKYRSVSYLSGEVRFHYKQGVFFRRKTFIPYEFIHSIVISNNIFPRIFGAKHLQVNSATSILRKSAINLWVSQKEKTGFSNIPLTVIYKGSFKRILLMATTWSNSLSGLIILAPIIQKVGNILGKKYEEQLYHTFDISTYIAMVGIPPLMAFIAGFIIVGYAVSFTVILFRYGLFEAFSGEKNENFVVINRGILNKNTFITKTMRINAIEIRQSILMRLLHISSVYINTIGTGIIKGDKSLLIAAESDTVINDTLRKFKLQPDYFQNKIKLPKRAWMSYLSLPLYFLIGAATLLVLLIFFGFFSPVVRLVFILAFPIIIIWVIFRLEAAKQSALSLSDNAVKICYFHKLNLTKTIIPIQKIQFCSVKQNIFQKIAHTCNVQFYVYSAKRTSFIIKNLDYKKTIELVKSVEKAY